MKPNLQQASMTYSSSPLKDFEWLSPEYVVLAIGRAVGIKNVSQCS